MACPTSPALLTLLGVPFGICAGTAKLENCYGETIGWNAPNQGYRVWNRWFPTDRDFIEPGKVEPQCRRQIRQTISAIERVTGSPFINKWQRNATRVRALHAVIPEAVFLQLRRDPILTIQSVLLARRERLSNADEWFSAMPRSYVRDAGKNHLRQATEQVALIEMDLEEDKRTIGQDKFFVLDYQELCNSPDLALEAFSSWYGTRTGVHLRQRRNLNIELAESKLIRISDREIEQIKEVLKGIGYFQQTT